MPGPLRWQEVSAPNFAGAQEGIRNFSNLISGAFDGLKSGVKEFDNSQTEDVNKEIMARLLQQQDPNALRAGIADGSFLKGIDPHRINAETLSALSTRPGQLIEQAAKFRANDRDLAMNELTPVAQQAYSLANQGKLAEAQALYDTHKDLVAKAGYTNFKSLLDDVHSGALGKIGYDSSALGLKSANTNYDQGVKRFGWEETDRNTEQAATVLSERLFKEFGGDPNSTESWLNQNDINPLVAAKVRAHFGLGQPRGFDGGGGGDMSIPSGGGNPNATNIMNYQAKAAGFAAVPPSVKTLGQASEFAKQVNRAGVASSAMGLYQIVGDTLRNYGPKVLGSGWQSAEFNAENQDKIAKAIFEDHRGSAADLRGQWTSLSAGEAEQLRKMPWEQARQVIARKESGGDPASLLPGVPASKVIAPSLQGAVEPVMAQSPLVTQYAQTATDTASANEVANRLTAGALKGTRSDWILEKIQMVQSKAAGMGHPITAATAGSIVEGSMQRQGWFEHMFKSGTKTLNDDLIEQQLKLVTSNKLSTAVNDYNQASQGMSNQQGAEAQLQLAQSRLRNAQLRGVRNLAPFQRDLAMAQALVGTATSQLAGETDRLRAPNPGKPLTRMAPPPPPKPVVLRPPAPAAPGANWSGAG